MTTATDDRRRLSIGQGIQAHTRSGAIGGGGCYTAPDGEPVVILCVDPHTGQPFEHELRAGQTFLLGNEEWEVSGVQGSSNPRWMATLTRVRTRLTRVPDLAGHDEHREQIRVREKSLHHTGSGVIGCVSSYLTEEGTPMVILLLGSDLQSGSVHDIYLGQIFALNDQEWEATSIVGAGSREWHAVLTRVA